MDFRFNDEEETFRTEVKEFLRAELPSGWDEQFDAESEMGMAAQGDFAKQFQKKLANRGWIALPWPKEYGGAAAWRTPVPPPASTWASPGWVLR